MSSDISDGDLDRLIELLRIEMGRLPTEDEVLNFINGTREERLAIIRKARSEE